MLLSNFWSHELDFDFDLLFPTSLCGVLVFWLPSRPPPRTAAAAATCPTHHHPLTQSVLSTSTSLSHACPHQSSCSHVHSTTLTHIQLHIILFTSPTHIISTDHHPHPLHLSHSYHLNIPRGRRSTQSLQKGLRRALSPLVPLAVLVAGAVPRASRRGCGARCRRWCRWLSSWQAQYPEPPEGAAARVVAAGTSGCPRGRRSIQSLQKGLRRALSPLVPLAACRVAGSYHLNIPRGRRSTQSLQKGLRRALSPLVPLAVLVAGAVPRASRRRCGARCRRWCRWLSSWQAQYQSLQMAAARVVAAGAAGCPRGRRSTQSLQKGLRRALSPLVPLAVLVAEPPEGAAARVVAAGAAGCPRGRRSTQSL